MALISHALKNLSVTLILAAIVFAACSGTAPQAAPATEMQSGLPGPTSSPATASGPTAALPVIGSVLSDRDELARYESLELIVAVEAQFVNPYDARQVRLEGVFTAPDGGEMAVPGFWDGRESWRVRFTPSQEGEWTYRLSVSDANGASQPVEGSFSVTPSEMHGWLQVGEWVDPAYSPRYLVYHDGAPFFGLGHGDALNILEDGFSLENGVGLFDKMKAAGENFVVWWPFYSASPVSSRYDQYSVGNLQTIDLVVKDAQKNGVFLVFTIWDHPELRARGHAWGEGRWEAQNGFNKLGDIDSFFTAEEAWAWQQNLYRYMIARWGYSPAIGMWQTVSEINGTNAYDQTDSWHARVSQYFAEHDPYRHPTTASMSGDVDWPAGFAAMDVPQVHVYALEGGPVKAASVIADWTERMWDQAGKPNWVGEFGVPDNRLYPEMFHNAIWAALGAGAALTPAEWNDRGQWGEMTDGMFADITRLAEFTAGLPLAAWNPVRLEISSSDRQVRAWGVGGEAGGVLWVQDFALEGQPVKAVRSDETVRKGVVLVVRGLAVGVYTVRPYDTWKGIYLESYQVTCPANQPCTLPMPDFKADLALRLER